MNDLFEPVPSILSREIENEPTREELASYAEALDKLVSIGTHLLYWELSDDADDSVSTDESTIVGTTFKRLLELLDSIALQVRVGAVDPAVVHLRVLFELSVQFEYFLEKDTQRRCYCSVLVDLYRQLEQLEKVAISERTSEQKVSISNLRKLIDKPVLKAIKTEYEQLKIILKKNKQKNKEIKWYNLFGPNLSDFSKLVAGKFKKYEVHYKAINKGFGNDAVHSTNLLRGNVIHEDGVPAVVQMRNSFEAIAITGIAFSIGKICCEVFVKRRTKERQSKYISAIMECEKLHKDIAFPGLHKMSS